MKSYQKAIEISVSAYLRFLNAWKNAKDATVFDEQIQWVRIYLDASVEQQSQLEMVSFIFEKDIDVVYEDVRAEARKAAPAYMEKFDGEVWPRICI